MRDDEPADGDTQEDFIRSVREEIKRAAGEEEPRPPENPHEFTEQSIRKERERRGLDDSE
jgi:hypothetical protein